MEMKHHREIHATDGRHRKTLVCVDLQKKPIATELLRKVLDRPCRRIGDAGVVRTLALSKKLCLILPHTCKAESLPFGGSRQAMDLSWSLGRLFVAGSRARHQATNEDFFKHSVRLKLTNYWVPRCTTYHVRTNLRSITEAERGEDVHVVQGTFH